MRKSLYRLMRYLRNVLITSAIVGIAAAILIIVFHFSAADTLQLAGMACALIGLFSLVGKMNMTTSLTYLQSRSVSKSIVDSTLDDYKSRDGNYKFMATMLGTAVILVIAGLLI